jgi:hypothetical protein
MWELQWAECRSGRARRGPRQELFARFSTAVVGSITTRYMDVCVCLFRVVLLCVHSLPAIVSEILLIRPCWSLLCYCFITRLITRKENSASFMYTLACRCGLSGRGYEVVVRSAGIVSVSL